MENSIRTLVREGDLASHLPWLQPFGLFSLWRLWIKGQSKAWQQNQEPDPEDQEGDGVPRQELRGENLQEVQVPDWSRCRCCWQFYWLNWFSVCSCANLFLSMKADCFSCAVSFKKNKIKIPDLSLPPCMYAILIYHSAYGTLAHNMWHPMIEERKVLLKYQTSSHTKGDEISLKTWGKQAGKGKGDLKSYTV